MCIIVTGGAGFIGSCIVGMLNEMGREDIIIVDHICNTEKWKNMRNKKYLEYINRNDFWSRLPEYKGKISHVIHMGACSSTTERDFDFLYKNNFEYTKKLWEFCTEEQISFIYASSAATYGDGREGFNDEDDIDKLQPLNGYGYSKQLFDLWASKQNRTPKQYVGFKFFNVYGPNEYFKGTMASVIFHSFNEINKTQEKGLFKSYKKEYADGEQKRDFVYVKDICKVVWFMIQHEDISGLFNLGTGEARTFNDLVKATFGAMCKDIQIKYIDMPESLREKYQYFTEAKMDKLRNVGYTETFYSLEDGVRDYVQNYLLVDYRIY